MCPIFCVYKILKNQLITLCATSIISGYFVASNGRAVLDLSINVWYNKTNAKELEEGKNISITKQTRAERRALVCEKTLKK